MNPKQKGNAGERSWAKFLRENDLDSKAWRNYGSGSTIYKSDVVNKLDYNFEVKCVKKLNLYKALKQTQRDAEMAHSKPSIVFHLDGMRDGEWWIIIDSYEWAKLMKKSAEPLLKQPDREMRYDLESLKIMCNKIIKRLE